MTSTNTTTGTAGTPRRGSRIGRMIGAAAAAAAIAGATALAAAGTAQASTYQFNNVYLAPASSAGSLMLDVSGGSTTPGAPVIQWWLNGGSNQKWNINVLADGNSQIINGKSGQCLTTDMVAGHGLYQFPCVSGSPNQEWNIHGLTTNDFYVRPITNPASGLSIDIYRSSRAAGATVDAWYDNGGDNQHFAAYQG